MPKLFSYSWFKILLLFITWQVTLVCFAHIFTQGHLLPFTPSYPGFEFLAQLHSSPLIYRWAGFDGYHYLTIAREGYLQTGGVQAFFPLYPLLIRFLTPVFFSPLLAGLFISSLSFYGFLLLGYQLLQKKYHSNIAWWFILIFLFSPASFFFIALYSESLFLFLTMATFYAYYHRHYPLVAFFGFLLSATRIIGILVPLAIGLDYLYHLYRSRQAIKLTQIKPLFFISLSFLGLFSYMLYLWHHFNDPLYFRTVQQMFASGRETSRFILLPQVYFRYFKMFYFGLPSTWKTYAIVQEFILTTFYLFGLIYTFWQNLRLRRLIYPWSWWIFSALAFIVPTMTGNFSSMTRYVLVSFVVTILLAKLYSRHPRLGFIFSFLSFIILLLNLLLFLQGFWVA